ncbi:MAG: hypothetical protein HZA90_18735 [Verrucomicrobia bacterium]|nr:hypothetical protein [Verrucomicrobiota bacterium]
MKACLGFDELLGAGQPQIGEMERLGALETKPDQPDAAAAFSRQVRILEGILVQNYGVAATLARKADDLQEVAEIWSRMGLFCQAALQSLARLKEKHPHGAAPELYDLALDYKLACDKRHRGVLEEIACQKTELPKGLFPEMK